MGSWGKAMRKRVVAAALLFGIGAARAEDSAWVQLFNGKDLANWDIKFTKHPLNTNLNNTFKVVDGVLKVDYSGWGTFNEEFGHAANKTRTWSYYLLRVEYQIGEKQVNGGPEWAIQNNGLMIHSQPMATMTLNQDFPISLETQLLGAANTRVVPSAFMNLCTPGTAFHTVPTGGSPSSAHCWGGSSAKRAAAGEWAWASLSVLGDSIIRHYKGPNPSGTPEVTYYRPIYQGGAVKNPPANVPANGTRLREGYIAIQAETHPYNFRRIEVLDLEGCLDKSSPAYRSYFVRSKPGACEASGVGAHPDRLPDEVFLVREAQGFTFGSTERGTLEVSDAAGRLFFRKEMAAGKRQTLTVPRKGLYLIGWRTAGGMARIKWVRL
jgi:hypothetical protein